MPPKIDKSDPKIHDLLERFATISLTGQKAEAVLQNVKKAEVLSQMIEKNDLSSKNLDAKGATLVVAASSSPPNDLTLESRDYVVKRIIDGSLTTTDRVTEACKYMVGVEDASKVDKASFDQACGVGECLEIQSSI